MIRINLLPISERKKTRALKLPTLPVAGQKAIWGVVALVAYAGMIMAMVTLQSRKISTLDVGIREAKEESAKLAPQLERIRKLTAEREEVNKRLNVIASLDKDRYFRVQILNDVSEKLPSNCWLTSLKEQSPSTFSIEGITFSNYIIADLMSNLARSDRFSGVSLNIAQEGKILDNKVIQFTLQSQVTPR